MSLILRQAAGDQRYKERLKEGKVTEDLQAAEEGRLPERFSTRRHDAWAYFQV